MREPVLTAYDRQFLSAIGLAVEPTQEEMVRLACKNFELRMALADAVYERNLYRSRFLWALSTAVGLAAGVVITVIVLWWLMAGLR